MPSRRTDALSVLAIVCLHLAMVAIVQPRGQFPINDDWAYTHSVQWLLQEQRVRLSDWIAMNLLPQTLLGGIAVAVAGFSFETLRHITQFVAVSTLLLAYAWLRLFSLGSKESLAGTVVLAAFPAWDILANSYMTDLYGLALGLASAIALVRWLRSPASLGWLVAGSVLAMLGVLQRQVVLVVPVATIAAQLWREPRDVRRASIAFVPLALTLAAEWAYQSYLRAGPGIPAAQLASHGRVLPLVWQALTNEGRHGEIVAIHGAQVAGLLGLCVAPWAALRGLPLSSARERAAFWIGLAVLATFSVAVDWHPPYAPNQVFEAFGIGPAMLRDNLLNVSPLDRSAGSLWPFVGIVALYGLLALVVVVGTAISRAIATRREGDPATVFNLVLAGVYVGTFVVTDYIDRYMLFPIPFLLALWPAATDGRRFLKVPIAGISLLAAMLILGALATRDFYSWNRVRWTAIHEAERLGGTPATIDGGFEYNGYYGHEHYHGLAIPSGKSWYWVRDDAFVVAFSVLPHYEVVARWPVKRVLPRTPSEILLLRRRQ